MHRSAGVKFLDEAKPTAVSGALPENFNWVADECEITVVASSYSIDSFHHSLFFHLKSRIEISRKCPPLFL